jgi:hypothetical protein
MKRYGLDKLEDEEAEIGPALNFDDPTEFLNQRKDYLDRKFEQQKQVNQVESNLPDFTTAESASKHFE